MRVYAELIDDRRLRKNRELKLIAAAAAKIFEVSLLTGEEM